RSCPPRGRLVVVRKGVANEVRIAAVVVAITQGSTIAAVAVGSIRAFRQEQTHRFLGRGRARALSAADAAEAAQSGAKCRARTAVHAGHVAAEPASTHIRRAVRIAGLPERQAPADPIDATPTRQIAPSTVTVEVAATPGAA